jgi:hypothetical protein
MNESSIDFLPSVDSNRASELGAGFSKGMAFIPFSIPIHGKR